MILASLLTFLVLLQVTALPALFDGYVLVDAVLVFVLGWSLIRSGREAMLMGFLAGLALSHFSTLHFGFLPLFYVLVTYLASLIGSDQFESHPILLAPYGLLLIAVFDGLIGLSYWLAGQPVELSFYLARVMVVRVVLNTGLLLVTLPALRRLAQLLYPTRLGVSHEPL